MRKAMIGIAIAVGLIPVAAQAQTLPAAVLKQENAYCAATLVPAPTMRTQVYTYFQLKDGALVRTDTSYRTSYTPTTKTAGSTEMPIKSATIAGSVGPAGSEPATVTHRLAFTAVIGAKLGGLTVRYLWNGTPVHEATPRVDMVEARQRGMADVTLQSPLPRALLKTARGRLDVVIVSTLKPEPLFQLTYQLQGFGMTDWHRSAAAAPDMDAAGVRPGDALPAKCL